MIDVPILVKDALREGAYRKNYRFIVEGKDEAEGFYELAKLAENQKLSVISNKIYKFVGEGANSWSGVTTWESWEPGTELEWLEPTTTSPNTELTTLIDANIISVSGFTDISYVTLYEWREAEHEDSFTIDNNNLVRESVMVDERMNSGDKIKFGLCEGASLEFQYFGLKNITGKRIQAFIDVEYKTASGTLAWHTIPMGYFTVDKCSRQASTGIIKVTAYNKLMSDYLDEKINGEIEEIAAEGEDGGTDVSFYYILKKLLEDYNIETYTVSIEWEDISSESLEDDTGFDWWLSSHGATVQEIVFPLFNSSGTSRGTYLHVQSFSLFTGGNSDVYFQDEFNVNVARNLKQSVYRAVDLDANYVRKLEQSEYISLRSFLIDDGCITTSVHTIGTVPLEMQQRLVAGKIEAYEETAFYSTLEANYITKMRNSLNTNVRFTLPYRVLINTSTSTTATMADYKTYFRPLHRTFTWLWKTYVMNVPGMAMQRIDSEEAANLADVTLRDLQSAVYESVCQFGQLDRVTDLFSGVELNRSRLLPAETLYPNNSLYPGGAAVSGFKSTYSKLWADEGNIHKWKDLIITYKGLDGEGNEIECTLQRTVNADGTDNYNMSGNWLFRNLVWAEEDVATYANAMVQKMRDLTWFPFEMWAAGLPYLETGDEIEIPLGQDTYVSYILQRQLKGIQNLQDTYINGTLDIF